MAKRDNELAGLILAEWALTGFKFNDSGNIAKKYNITSRTLRNWRNDLDKDDELSTSFQLALKELSTGQKPTDLNRKHWASVMHDALIDLTEDVRRLWLEMFKEANTWDKKVQLFSLAVTYSAQLTEPQIVREIVNGSTTTEESTKLPALEETSDAESYGSN